MRFNLYILPLVLAAMASTTLEADVLRFSAPSWRDDIGLKLPLPQGYDAKPLEMPLAEAYLISDAKSYRLEDRFDTFELWSALAVRGRWCDSNGNEFMIARLGAKLPPGDLGEMVTRAKFRGSLKKLDVKDSAARDAAAAALMMFDLSPAERARRSGRRNLLELWHYPLTNEAALVYVFRPRSPERREVPAWYMASFVAAEGADVDMEEIEEIFDTEFLEEVSLPPARERTASVKAPPPAATETDLLAEDYRLNVANYDDWHFFRAGDLLLTDNLEDHIRRPFVTTLTNMLPRLRREYAKAVPSAMADGFHPAVIRVFRSREEYLAYVGLEARWTAAVWSPQRRELVLYLSESGLKETLATLWHEAFHQYLAYAGSMISASPWINEGHAEVFEHSHFNSKGELVCERDAEKAAFINLNAAKLADFIPTLLAMDYEEFYAGDSFERQDKYRLAWSIAYFLQVGADEVRFKPFAQTRAQYLAELVKTRSAAAATKKVLSGEQLDDFIAEWLKFWRRK